MIHAAACLIKNQILCTQHESDSETWYWNRDNHFVFIPKASFVISDWQPCKTSSYKTMPIESHETKQCHSTTIVYLGSWERSCNGFQVSTNWIQTWIQFMVWWGKVVLAVAKMSESTLPIFVIAGFTRFAQLIWIIM